MEYVVVYEKAGNNFSAYAPDLPGFIACGDTLKETAALMKEAIQLYLETLKKEGQSMPQSTTTVEVVSISFQD